MNGNDTQSQSPGQVLKQKKEKKRKEKEKKERKK